MKYLFLQLPVPSINILFTLYKSYEIIQLF